MPNVLNKDAEPSRPSSSHSQNIRFGVTNVATPSPPQTPANPSSSTAFSQYVNTSTGFFPVPVSGPPTGTPAILASAPGVTPGFGHGDNSSRVPFGCPLGPTSTPHQQRGQGWAPFGGAYSVTATLTEDLRRAGIATTSRLERVFGAEQYLAQPGVGDNSQPMPHPPRNSQPQWQQFQPVNPPSQLHQPPMGMGSGLNTFMGAGTASPSGTPRKERLRLRSDRKGKGKAKEATRR